MAYCDYEFYTTQFYGAQITQDDFPRLAERASDYIYAYTKGRSDTVTGKAQEMVKKATCAIAEVLQDEQAAVSKRTESGGGVVASETVGAWSRSYATGVNVSEAEYLEKRKLDWIYLYLGILPEFAGLFRVSSYRCIHDARGCGRR